MSVDQQLAAAATVRGEIGGAGGVAPAELLIHPKLHAKVTLSLGIDAPHYMSPESASGVDAKRLETKAYSGEGGLPQRCGLIIIDGDAHLSVGLVARELLADVGAVFFAKELQGRSPHDPQPFGRGSAGGSRSPFRRDH